jgi:predicted amidohydrolase
MVFNTCFVFERGREVARYRKRWLMPGEERAGVTAGREPIVVDVRGFRLGLMICADVLHEESYLEMASLRPEIICVPTNSPFRPEDPIAEKLERDQTYFVEGARRSGAWVVKACTVGRIFGRPVQGRSLVAGPRGVVARVPYDREGKACLLTADLEVQRGR